MERLTDCAQGYCEMYCKKYGHCFGEPGDCIFKDEIKLYDAVKSIEGIVPFDRLLELACADKAGLVRILPRGEDGTCGGCGHFKRIPGKRCGTCEVRPNYTDRRGSVEAHRGTFTPSQSRKCCKQYIPREEAEAAMAQKGGAE